MLTAREVLGFIVTAVYDELDVIHNIQVGDVITHINGIPVGIYNGHHSIGDVTWFLGKCSIRPTLGCSGTWGRRDKCAAAQHHVVFLPAALVSNARPKRTRRL